MAKRDTVDLLGVRIDNVGMSDTVQTIDRFIAQGGTHQIVTLNVNVITIACRDAEFMKIINAADLVVPDGVPLLWAARLLGTPLSGRVNGTDLVYACCKLAVQKGYRVYVLGAAPGIGMLAAERLIRECPGLQVAGVYAPPYGDFSPAEREKMIRQIVSVRPHILFVALGAPKQDTWIYEQRDTINVPVCVGIGGSLDLISGKIKRAPRWMQRRGLEWLYRLFREPKRLWKRYLIGNTVFMGSIISVRIRKMIS